MILKFTLTCVGNILPNSAQFGNGGEPYDLSYVVTKAQDVYITSRAIDAPGTDVMLPSSRQTA